MSNVTILRPTWGGASTAKTFVLDENTKLPKLESSYDLGKTFTHATTTVKNVKELYTLLDRCKDKPVFRIYGSPVVGLPTHTRRKKENFDCEETNIILLDADNWPVPEGFSITTPDGIYKTVKEILVNKMGLTAFDGVQFCCLLSSSSWSKASLRAHLYFMTDSPVLLSDLHTWGFDHNAGGTEYKIDYSLFRQVQPDYISKRICLGFADPLKDALRLTLHCDHLSPYVKKVDLTKHFLDTAARAAQTPLYNAAAPTDPNDPYATNRLVSQVPIGKTWDKTLLQCGTTTHGINEPAYRACAQLVQEEGDQIVAANLVFYVNEVFKKMWAAIVANNVRGGKEDRELYTREKIRGYIQTAISKKFGAQADLAIQSVMSAIDAIVKGANPSVIFSRECIECIQNLRTKLPEKWMHVKGIIKRDLRGKVSVTDLEKAAKDSDDKLDKGLMMEEIIKNYTWVEGENDNGLYCMRYIGDKYKLMPLDEAGGDILSSLNNLYNYNVPIRFEASVIGEVMARKDDPIRSPFTRRPVETRCHSVLSKGKSMVYYNMGTTLDGEMRTAVIDASGVRVVPSKTVPVLWLQSSIVKEARLAEFEEEIELLGEVGREMYIDEFLQGMRQFSSTFDDQDLVELVAWQAVALANTGTSNLLQVTGASGDGKSSTALFAKELVDPTSNSLRDGPDLHSVLYQNQDLAKVLRRRHITIFDNMSKLQPREQDTLCSVATGWKYDLRVMYTQSYLDLLIKRPVVLTALSPIVTHQDLRSRTMSVLVAKDRKQVVEDMYTLWESESPRIRVGMLFFLSEIIRRIDKRRDKQGVMNDRDLWGVQARVVASKSLGLLDLTGKSGTPVKLTDGQLTELVGERKRAEDTNEALLSSTTSLIITWVLQDPLFKGNGNFTMTSQEAFLKFTKFVNENAGTVFDIKGYAIQVSPRDLPVNARGFASRLGHGVNDISLVTGWSIRGERSSGKRWWSFTKITG